MTEAAARTCLRLTWAAGVADEYCGEDAVAGYVLCSAHLLEDEGLELSDWLADWRGEAA